MNNKEIKKVLHCCMEWAENDSNPDCENCPKEKNKPFRINLQMAAVTRIEQLEAENALLNEALFIAAKDVVELKGYEPWEIAILAKDIYIPDVLKEAKQKLKQEKKND